MNPARHGADAGEIPFIDLKGQYRAIKPVSLYGQPAEMDEINAIAAMHSLPVIENAAQRRRPSRALWAARP